MLQLVLRRSINRPLRHITDSQLVTHGGTFPDTMPRIGREAEFHTLKTRIQGLFQGRGGWMVGPANGAAPADAMPRARTPDEGQPAERSAPTQGRPTAVLGTRALGSIQIRRWPLYLRNVKQLLRQASPSFDERAYGFTSLVDLLRAAHKEGAFRVDRDRQGVVRVFQGTAPADLVADTPAPVVMDESRDVSDVDVPLGAADIDVPLVVADAPTDESPQAAEEPAPAPRSRRRRRPRTTDATRTSRRKTAPAGKAPV